jgi:large subunit ribosomal protein L17
MRHLGSVNHLGRTSSHRKAMLSNMASSLILHKKIVTTIAKAKSLRGYVEPLITKSKEDTTQSRRLVFSYLQDKKAVNELFREVAGKIMTRPGGYTRILKTGFRHGDNADMCIIELVDYNENMLSAASGKAKASAKKSRRGGAAKKKADTAVKAKVADTKKAEPSVPEKEPENGTPVAGEAEETKE